MRTIRIFNSRSPTSERVGSPHTCSTRMPRTIRLAPTVYGTMGMALSKATGIPARSSSFAIVAPQRLQLPQVATRITAPTPADDSSSTIRSPIRRAAFTAVPLPVVAR